MRPTPDKGDAEGDTMTYPEAARLLGVKRESVYTLVHRGNLHPVVGANGRTKSLLRAEVMKYAGLTSGALDELDERNTLTYEHASRLLGVVPERVYVMVSNRIFQPVKIAGDRTNRLKREDVEQYIAGRQLSRADVAREASTLLTAILWGVSDEGVGGEQARQQILEEIKLLSVSVAGRQQLTAIRANLLDILGSEPIKSAVSARGERERFGQIAELITAELTARERRQLAKKSPDAPTSKRPRRKPAKSPPASLDSNMTASAK